MLGRLSNKQNMLWSGTENSDRQEHGAVPVGSVVKKRRKKMSKHKHRKRIKANRHKNKK